MDGSNEKRQERESAKAGMEAFALMLKGAVEAGSREAFDFVLGSKWARGASMGNLMPSVEAAGRLGRVDLLDDLLARGSKWGVWLDRGSSVLGAADFGHGQCLESLARAGASLDMVDEDKETPLLRAINCDDESIARKLVELGASPNAVGGGSEPLVEAGKMAMADLMRDLIGAGADVEASDDLGRTPLMCAGVQRDAKIALVMIGVLAKAGAKLDALDKDGRTAAYYAAQNGNEAAMLELLSLGASCVSPSALSADPFGPRDLLWIAVKNGEASVARRLLDILGPGSPREAKRTSEQWEHVAEDMEACGLLEVARALEAQLEARGLGLSCGSSLGADGSSSEKPRSFSKRV